MSRGKEKVKRWRPRFSVRTLAIVVTLVCTYFGAWEVTKKYGVLETQLKMGWQNVALPGELQPSTYYGESSSPMSFVIIREEFDVRAGMIFAPQKRYYLWLFGPPLRLLIETS
jgi:hypothetical protein